MYVIIIFLFILTFLISIALFTKFIQSHYNPLYFQLNNISCKKRIIFKESDIIENINEYQLSLLLNSKSYFMIFLYFGSSFYCDGYTMIYEHSINNKFINQIKSRNKYLERYNDYTIQYELINFYYFDCEQYLFTCHKLLQSFSPIPNNLPILLAYNFKGYLFIYNTSYYY